MKGLQISVSNEVALAMIKLVGKITLVVLGLIATYLKVS